MAFGIPPNFPTQNQIIANSNKLIGDRFPAGQYTIGGILVDVLSSYTVQHSWDTTDLAVYSSLSSTEYRRKKPMQYSLDCKIFSDEATVSSVSMPRTPPLASAGMPTVNHTDPLLGQSWAQKRTAFLKMANANDLISIKLIHGDEVSVHITDISEDKTPENAGAWFFSLGIKEIRIISIEKGTIDLPVEKQPIKNKGNKPKPKPDIFSATTDAEFDSALWG